MKQPRLSIITPVYQGRHKMAECLENVISQDCALLEHLVIDGGSNDGTQDILQEYCGRYGHIRYVSERDRGQSHAMNKGLAMAVGDIVGILNVDDFYEPGTLNSVMELFHELPTPSLLVGNCNVLEDADRFLFLNKPRQLKHWQLLTGSDHPTNPSAYFYHKSIHSLIGPYDEDQHFTMDLDFLLKATKVANVKYVDQCWGNFRLVRGTKTFESMANGMNDVRKQRLHESFILKLPVREQIWVRLLRRPLFAKLYRRLRRIWDRMIVLGEVHLGRS